MEMAKVTSKGQITIPVSIRRRLDIKEGDNLLFLDSPEGVIMVNPDMLQEKKIKTVNKEEREKKKDENVEEKKDENVEEKISVHEAEKTLEDLEEILDENNSEPQTTASAAPNNQINGLNLTSLLDELRSIGSIS